MLSHVKELIEQNKEELLEQYPECDIGVYCASLNRKDRMSDVTYATIQSMHNNLIKLSKPPEIIIVDECHLISHNKDTMYRKLIDDALHLNHNCRIIGLTGTPFRSDTGRLDEGDDRVFDNICYEIGMGYMIEQGYWTKPFCPDIETHLDVSGVSVRGGDYVQGELERAVNIDPITKSCVDEIIAKAANRNKWLVFAVGKDHAQSIAEEIRSRGISAEYLTSDHSPMERARIIQDFREGRIRCLVNVAILTTGFNVPDIDMIAFMRPTRSPVLYIQMIGRGVRVVYANGYDLSTKEGRLDAIANSIKQDCMVLDFGDVVSELGAIDDVSIEKTYIANDDKEKGDGEATFKICPSCNYECAPAQRVCHNCEHVFLNIKERSETKAKVVSSDYEPEWADVIQVFYDKHNKQGSHPTLKVGYSTLNHGIIYQWVCFEHHKFDPTDKRRYGWNSAVKWYNERALDNMPVPNTVDDARTRYYKEPSRIKVKRDGKYWKILDFEFAEKEEEIEEDFFEIPF